MGAMLGRRILRVNAFKALYAYAEDPGLTLKEALSYMDALGESVQSLCLFLLGLVPALQGEARRRGEAAQGLFHPSDAASCPGIPLADSALATSLGSDPDFARLTKKKVVPFWEKNASYVHALCSRICERAQSLPAAQANDAALWRQVFGEMLCDDTSLLGLLEDECIHWNDQFEHALSLCQRSLDSVARTGVWNLPELCADADRQFARKLLSTAYGRYGEYAAEVASLVSGWDRDRIFVVDTVLIVLGLSEATAFADIPARVTVNEYVEITKAFSTPQSGRFVNGLLDRLIRAHAERGEISKSFDRA